MKVLVEGYVIDLSKVLHITEVTERAMFIAHYVGFTIEFLNKKELQINSKAFNSYKHPDTFEDGLKKAFEQYTDLRNRLVEFWAGIPKEDIPTFNIKS